MDSLTTYRQIVQEVLRDYAKDPYSYGDITQELVFDRDRDRYLLMLVGRQGPQRVHGCLIHVDLMDGKVWIQRDGTEEGVARDFLRAGVPKEDIVLGFRLPELREGADFAVA
jgi:hypothetical protein